MNRKLVHQQIQECTTEELKQWKAHAVNCLHYYLKYRDEFEIDECNFIITHIDNQLMKVK